MKDRIARVKKWAILNNEKFKKSKLLEMIENINVEGLTKHYFACGHDVKRSKYDKDWLCTDIRDIPKSQKWDILLGHPFEDNTLTEVKSKLAVGMLTYSQAKFVIRDTARVLEVGGKFILTFRNFDLLLKRRDDIPWKLFNRYLHGSGLYYGALRKACWIEEDLLKIAKAYKLELSKDPKHTGMNTTLSFIRKKGKLKAFTPEPKVQRDAKGNVINLGGDFPDA